MAVTIITTPGASNANSYGSLEEADAYFEGHVASETWADLDEDRKKALLVYATRILEMAGWSGDSYKSTAEQSLSFPRTDLYDVDGYEIEGIPEKLKWAQFEIALWYQTEEERPASNFQLKNLDSFSVGPLSFNIRSDAEDASAIPSHVKVMLMGIAPGLYEDVSADDGSSYWMVL